MPEGFGLLRPQKGRVIQRIAARKKRKEEVNPPALFWCAFMRAVNGKAAALEVEAARYATLRGRDISVRDIADLARRADRWAVERLQKQVERLQNSNRDMMRASTTERARRKTSSREWLNNGHQLLRIALKAVGLPEFNYDLTEARKRFAAIEAPKNAAALATTLRDMADTLESLGDGSGRAPTET